MSGGHFMSFARERRAAPRRRTYLGGEIVSAEATGEANCVIRSLSATGAGLRLSGAVPTKFVLKIPRDKAAHRARLVRRKGKGEECGVAFDGDDEKAEATPLPIMALRRSLRFQTVEE
jgi:hypothetical protein